MDAILGSVPLAWGPWPWPRRKMTIQEALVGVSGSNGCTKASIDSHGHSCCCNTWFLQPFSAESSKHDQEATSGGPKREGLPVGQALSPWTCFFERWWLRWWWRHCHRRWQFPSPMGSSEASTFLAQPGELAEVKCWRQLPVSLPWISMGLLNPNLGPNVWCGRNSSGGGKPSGVLGVVAALIMTLELAHCLSSIIIQKRPCPSKHHSHSQIQSVSCPFCLAKIVLQGNACWIRWVGVVEEARAVGIQWTFSSSFFLSLSFWSFWVLLVP